MNIPVFIFCLFGLQALCMYIGWRSSKGLKNQNDYFLAGKSIRFWPLMMTFLATQVGGGLILGSAEEAYKFGWTVLFYPLGAALGLLLLGVGVGRKLASFKVSTTAQIFEAFYGSPNLKRIASLLSIVSLFMILVAQIIASNKFMGSLGLESWMWTVGFWSIVILYTAVGGLKSVVDTDIIQASFFVLIFLFSFGYAFFTADVSMTQMLNVGIKGDTFAFESTKLFGWLFMPLLFMVIEQDMAQRCFAAESGRTVSKATFWAGVGTLIVCVIPVFFGVLAKSSGLNIPVGSSVLITVIQQTTTPFISAFVGCAIMAAIISTADALINAIGSNLSQDFDLSVRNCKSLRVSQGLAIVISVAALLFSFFFNNVVDMLIQSYELSVSCLFVPIFLALFKKQGNTLSAGLAVAFGALGFIAFKAIPITWPKELISILLSLLGYGCGELLVWIGSRSIQLDEVAYEE